MKKAKQILIFIFILAILILPVFSIVHAEGGLVPCSNTPDDKGNIANPCGFNEFMGLINKLIDFVLLYLALPIAAIMFAYAGVLLVTSGGSTESRGKAKNIFTSTLIGLVLAAGGWLIVKTFLSIAGYKDIWLFLKNKK